MCHAEFGNLPNTSIILLFYSNVLLEVAVCTYATSLSLHIQGWHRQINLCVAI